MAKANSPLSALENLEEELNAQSSRSLAVPAAEKQKNNSNANQLNANKIEENESDLETELGQVSSEGRYVTRNYGYKMTIDQDIDELRVKLKKAGVAKTKQDLVNQLLQERLTQLKVKGFL